MSGRPRTTSFAESCKPVAQPSAFGSMKVSSEYQWSGGDGEETHIKHIAHTSHHAHIASSLTKRETINTSSYLFYFVVRWFTSLNCVWLSPAVGWHPVQSVAWVPWGRLQTPSWPCGKNGWTHWLELALTLPSASWNFWDTAGRYTLSIYCNKLSPCVFLRHCDIF